MRYVYLRAEDIDSVSWQTLSAEDLEREYSPSSMVSDIEPILSWYSTQSQRVREDQSVNLFTNLSYGSSSEEKLDLFLPDLSIQTKGLPLLVFVHGGYWQQHSKNDYSFPAAAWTSVGYAFASINYGLAPSSNIPQMISRCRRALNWLGENHVNYGFDKEKIHVMGHSAGAHLLACAISPDIQDHDKPQLFFRPQRAILVGGIYDLQPITQTYVNEPLGLSIESSRMLSPQFFDCEPLVALDIVYAEYETSEFIRQSKAYAEKCSKRTAYTKLVEVPGRHHFDIMLDMSRANTEIFKQLSEQR